jgi:hypothetical protein
MRSPHAFEPPEPRARSRRPQAPRRCGMRSALTITLSKSTRPARKVYILLDDGKFDKHGVANTPRPLPGRRSRQSQGARP